MRPVLNGCEALAIHELASSLRGQALRGRFAGLYLRHNTQYLGLYFTLTSYSPFFHRHLTFNCHLTIYSGRIDIRGLPEESKARLITQIRTFFEDYDVQLAHSDAIPIFSAEEDPWRMLIVLHVRSDAHNRLRGWRQAVLRACGVRDGMMEQAPVNSHISVDGVTFPPLSHREE